MSGGEKETVRGVVTVVVEKKVIGRTYSGGNSRVHIWPWGKR